MIIERQEDRVDTRLSSIKTWKVVLPYVKPYIKQIIILGILMLIAAGIDVVMPLLSGYAVSQFIEPRTLDGMVMFIGVCVVLIIAQASTTFFMAKTALKVEMYIAKDLKSDLYRHLQKLGFDYFNTTPVGTILARVMSDTMSIGTIFAWSLVDVIWGVACIVGYVFMMFQINADLAWLVVSVVPPIAIFTYVFQHIASKAKSKKC